MQWWAWITVGALLLGSELTFVNAQFYLVFVGAAALMVGFLTLAGALPADWIQWSLFALLAILSLIAFRRRVYERVRRRRSAPGSLESCNGGPGLPSVPCCWVPS